MWEIIPTNSPAAFEHNDKLSSLKSNESSDDLKLLVIFVPVSFWPVVGPYKKQD
jgi:hypothetical protein